MKVSLILLVSLGLWASCNNAGLFKDAMVMVNADWEKTDQGLHHFTDSLTNVYAHWDTLDNVTALPAGSMQLLPDSIRTQVRNLQKKFTEYGAALREIGRHYNARKKDWDQQREELAQLNQAVAHSEKMPDIEKRIRTLQDTIVATNSDLRHWMLDLDELITNLAKDERAFDALRWHWES